MQAPTGRQKDPQFNMLGFRMMSAESNHTQHKFMGRWFKTMSPLPAKVVRGTPAWMSGFVNRTVTIIITCSRVTMLRTVGSAAGRSFGQCIIEVVGSATAAVDSTSMAGRSDWRWGLNTPSNGRQQCLHHRRQHNKQQRHFRTGGVTSDLFTRWQKQFVIAGYGYKVRPQISLSPRNQGSHLTLCHWTPFVYMLNGIEIHQTG